MPWLTDFQGELADGAEIRDGADFDVAEMAIEGQQLGSHAEDDDVDSLAGFRAEMFLPRPGP